MKKIVFATSNKDKAKELKEIFTDYDILTLDDIGFEGEIVEDGATFEENALIKAKAAFEACGLPCVADDSGLCVDALNGAPGIYSARYSGGGYLDNCLKLMQEMKDVPEEKRGAQFVSAAALYAKKGDEIISAFTLGKVPGKIGFEMKGEGGFGYDPLFIENSTMLTYAEMTKEEKNSLSHRKLAFEALKPEVEKLFEEE